jgi:glycosyltransferase involved in cell wall biosynthesis
MANKILTIVGSLGKGGTERAAQTFAEAYAQLNMDSRLLALKEGGVGEKALAENSIQYWVGDNTQNIKEIDDWNPDIIHIHSHGFKGDLFDRFPHLFRNRYIVEQSVFSNPSPWMSKVNISFQMTLWCEWRFRRNKSSHGLRTDIVPYPVKIKAFAKSSIEKVQEFREAHGISHDALVIGRIGQSIEAKWSPLLVDSFNTLQKKYGSLNLLLVNPPPSVFRQAQKSRFKDSIIIIEKIIGDDHLSVAYSSMDIFALVASQGESFGNVLVESMLCETPVVTLSTPWKDNSQCEVVGHMKGGLVATSPKGFQNALQKLIEEKNLRECLGKNGRMRVIDRYDSINVAKMVLKAIRSESESVTQRQLHNKIISIYKDAFDNPSKLSTLILRFNRKLGLIRYTSLYESPAQIPSDILRTIYEFISLKKFTNP